jgi:hypothetical protein
MLDPTIWLSPAIAVLICYFYFIFTNAKVAKLAQLNEYCAEKIDTQSVLIAEKKKLISDLEAKVKSLENQQPKNGRELLDFMQDLKTNGYGVVRIDPDSIFYRGTR